MGIGAVCLVALGWLAPGEIVDIAKRFPGLVQPQTLGKIDVRGFVERLVRRPKPKECAPPEPIVELVSGPKLVTTTIPPSESVAVGPKWLVAVLALLSGGLGLLAACWWFLDQRYKEDRELAKVESQQRREAAVGQTETLGALYDVDRSPPLETSAIDDAATLLGRLARLDTGYDLDVPRTIDATIDAGGRVKPVFAPSGHRDAVLVWVDIESGQHPFLDGVEWILERWKRLGVQFVRYNYRDTPAKLESHPDKRSISLDRLGRRTEGMPLIIFSRMAMPQDFHGQMPWLGQLEPWPVRAWIDLHPHGTNPVRGEVAQLLPRITARLWRYPLTKAGLVACATMIAARGEKAEQKDEPLSAPDPDIERALMWWAGAAACVPNPTWTHLEDLRRFLPEVHRALPHTRDVQRLIDYTRARAVGEGDVGYGESLRFSEDGRQKLLTELREQDARVFGEDKPTATVEHRVRLRLISQLERARKAGDTFGEAKRDMKIAVHRAAIGERDIPSLIEEFGRSPAAPELEPLLLELKHLQKANLPGPTKRWTVPMEEVVAAWVGTLRGARVADFAHPRSWKAPWKWVLAALGLVVANLVVLGLLRPFRAAESRVVENPTSWKVVVPDEPPALCDVAPMRFVKIPAGEFVMGSPPTEKNRDDDETQHRVKVDTFEMGAYEVTQKQWETVMDTRPFDCSFGGPCDPEKPAQKVNMYDAMRFLNKLTDRENRGKPLEQQRTKCYDETNWSWDRACTGYRLPTEAEWEYAARAGTTTAYSFGDQVKDLCTYGNFADQSRKVAHPGWAVEDDACDDRNPDLAPVGKYKPNPWGLFDMHGNVWEWTWDKYGSYDDKPMTNDTNKPSDNVTDSDKRVLRGGSFGFGSWWLRSANRSGDQPTNSHGDVGFRCVRVVGAQR